MHQPTVRVKRFGPYTLDLERSRLARGEQPVHLRAKTFALLRYLADRPGCVVSKTELLDALWPDVTVSEDSLTQAVSDLRRALGVEAKAILKTVPRRGYVLEAEAPPAPAATSDGPPLVLVLPFRLRKGTEEDAELLDAMVEEITHALGRFGQLRVVARHSAFRFRPETSAPDVAAAELGADFFVEGVGHRSEDGLRIMTSLCETATGRQVWAERFDASAETFRDVQIAIPHRIVTRLTLDLQRSLESVPGSTDDLGAYRHFIAAVGLLRQYGPGVNERARDHLDAAIAIDPHFALAHAYRGLAEIILGNYAAADRATLDRAMAHINEGLRLAPEEARCHWMAAQAQLYRREHGAAELHARRALDLNPCDADSMALYGSILRARGRVDEALEWYDRAVAMNPLHPPWYHHSWAKALQSAGRYAEAISHLASLPPSAFRATRLATCHAMLGNRDEAARYLMQAEAISPGWDAIRETGTTDDFEFAADRERHLATVAAALDCCPPRAAR